MEEKQYSFNDYVRLQIDSGLKPLELNFYPIIAVDDTLAYAFRASTKINSIILGEMKQDEYTKVSDERLCGIELFKHNIQHAINTLRAFDKAHRRCDFIAVRCPSKLIERCSLYEVVKEVLEKNPSVNPERICVEFTENLMEIPDELAKYSILDMKLLHLRTALVGAGKEDFLISRLVSLPVDMVILDKSASEWAGSRNKPQLFNSLLSYIKAMGVDSIAVGNEDQKKEMHFSEAIGFMFEGNDPITFEEALSVTEEVDS